MRCNYRKNAGYTLTEIGIVLAVIGIILGGVWVLGNSAMESARRYQMVDIVTYTVTKIREYYQGQAAITAGGFSGAGSLTDAIIRRDLVPREIVVNRDLTSATPLTARTPWGQAFEISDNTDTGLASNIPNRQSFRLRINGLDFSQCTEVVPRIMSASVKGLTAAVIVSADRGTRIARPSVNNNVDADCSQVNPNQVDLIYRLRS